MDGQLSTVMAEVKAAFEAYLTANGSVRERARLHGEALVRLKAACAERKLHFVDTIKELGVVVSTAYHHLALVACWDQAQDTARTMGLRFDALCISEVIELVRGPRKPKKAVEPSAGNTTPQPAAAPAEPSPSVGSHEPLDEVFAQAGHVAAPAPPPPSTHPIRPVAPPVVDPLRELIDRNLVRVIHAERGRSVEVEVGDRPVLVVPR